MSENISSTGAGTVKSGFISGSALKLIALITMMIDHVALHLLKCIPEMNIEWFSVLGFSCTAVTLCRLIGRTAFPLYCFLIAEGAFYTHSRVRYGISLLAFAFISEIPWNLEHVDALVMPNSQNVFFTLFYGFLLICVFDKLRSRILPCTAALIGVLILTLVSHADYGIFGALLIFLMYLLREKRAALCVIGPMLTTALWKVIPAFILIALYNGKRGFIKGKVMKYLFYAAYPVHIFIIWLIKKYCFGYG